jgi:sugar lactone lactonase YvrE
MRLGIWKIAFLSLLIFQIFLSLPAHCQIIDTYAGPKLPQLGAQAHSQPIDQPTAVALDGSGGFYVVSSGQNRVYSVAVDGRLGLIAGTGEFGFSGNGGSATDAKFRSPYDIAVDSSGNIYISDNGNNQVRKISPDGIISAYAGNGTPGFSGDGGPATQAQLNSPYGLALDKSGNLLIVDSSNCMIRRVSPDGIISTIAGTGACGYNGDGALQASIATLNSPRDVAVDSMGNIYISDTGNQRIRKLRNDGTIITIAGDGTANSNGDNGPAAFAEIRNPYGLAVDSADNLYITENSYLEAQGVVRMITPAGVICRVAGSSTDGFLDGNIILSEPTGITIDAANNMYIASRYNNMVVVVTPARLVNTIAGDGTMGSTPDKILASESRLVNPQNIIFDPAGNLIYAEDLNTIALNEGFRSRIRKIDSSGVVNTIAGGGNESDSAIIATNLTLFGNRGIALDAAGNFYFILLNFIYKLAPDGTDSIIAGSNISGFGGDGGPANVAQLYYPHGIAIDPVGNIFIADTENYRIRKITPAGIISAIAGTGVGGFSGDGGPATGAQIGYVMGLAADSAGNIYLADADNNRIRKITPAGIITTIAGTEDGGFGGFSGDGGPATSARLNFPEGIFIDSPGNVYIADMDNNRIRKIAPNGVITTIAGNGTQGYSGDGGLATDAQLNHPAGVAVDPAGNIYIADYNNNRVRVIYASSPTVSTVGVSSIKQTTATISGTVSAMDSATITAKGVCWGLSANPTTANSCINAGAGAASFSSSITGLTANTTYHARAYAVYSAGTIYGSNIAFTSLAPADLVITSSTGLFYKSIPAGSNAVYNLSASGVNDFAGNVNFSCSSLPANTTCSVNPTTLSISGSASSSLTVTLKTTARASSGVIIGFTDSPWKPTIPALLAVASLGIIFGMPKRRRLSLAMAGLFCIFGLSGCGGGGTTSSSNNTQPSVSGTPAGSYKVELNISGAVTRTIILTLDVQ